MNDPFKKTNRIYKCIAGETLHWRHFLTGPMVRRMTLIENRYPVTQLPMCGNCEKAAMWHHNTQGDMVGWCEECNTTTVNPITFSEYLVEGYNLPMEVRNSQLGRDVRQLLDFYDGVYGMGEGAR